MPVASMIELLEAGVHFGHQTQRWNPKMKPYIYGARNGIYVLDLRKTTDLLDEAYTVVREFAAHNKNILFVGTKKQAAEVVAEEAARAGAYYINRRWLGGMLTNFETIRGRINKLRELEDFMNSGHAEKLPKKEIAKLNRELGKLSKTLGGIKDMRGLPDIIFIVDQQKEAGLENIIYLIAFLSVNVGVINLIPFPAFDGGKILFLIIEKIKGSPVSSKVENTIHQIGFFLLLLLMIYVTFNDIFRLF